MFPRRCDRNTSELPQKGQGRLESELINQSFPTIILETTGLVLQLYQDVGHGGRHHFSQPHHRRIPDRLQNRISNRIVVRHGLPPTPRRSLRFWN
jgi:hypothetical protein